jgi:hypothetical protein
MRRPSPRRVVPLLRRFGFLTAIITLAATGLVSPLPAPPALAEQAVPLVPPGHTPPIGWAKTVTPPIASELVAARWEGSSAGAVDVRVKNAQGWSAWQRLEGNPDEGPDVGSRERRPFTSAGPAWAGRGVEQIQVKVAEGRLPGLRLDVVHSPADGDRSASIPLAGASPGQPGFITRAQWGADESYRTLGTDCTGRPDYAASVKFAVVHHTVNVNTYTADEADDLVRGIYYFHTHGNGWCDVGYNFLVDRFGRVYEGRFGGVDRPVIGAHSGGFNTSSTGVAMIGDYQAVAPVAATLTGVRDLLAWKLAYHGVDPRSQVTVTSNGSTRYPSGQVVTLPNVIGHRDVSETECPGDQGYPKIGALRIDVQNAILATQPFPLAGWTPASGQPRLFAVNAYGGLQPAGAQQAVVHSGYWPGWKIARGAAAAGGAGYVLDGWGGLHNFGNAPPATGYAYWPGWDIARGVAMTGAGTGYSLDGWGGVHPFGGAPPLPYSGYWQGWDIARGIAVRSDGLGGFVLDGWGGVHPFGAAAPVNVTGYWQGWDIARGIALRSDGVSGYVLDGWGGVHPFGGAPRLATTRYTPGSDEMRGIVLNAAGNGGWVVDLNGFLWPFGSATALKQSGTWTGAGAGRGAVLITG